MPIHYRGDRLHRGERLTTNEALLSPNGQFALVLQEDGNLVEYRVGSTDAIWASNTEGRAVAWAVLQEDGNFVIYAPDGQPIFASGTDGRRVAWLAMQDDGNLVIYETSGAAPWATGIPTVSEPEPDVATENYCCTIYYGGDRGTLSETIEARSYAHAVQTCNGIRSQRGAVGMQVSRGDC